jgi:hypothetical protein
MEYSSTWTIVLRCYSCQTRFTVPHLNFDTLTTLPLVAPCPNCGTQPVLSSKPENRGASKMHVVLDLMHDRREIAKHRIA